MNQVFNPVNGDGEMEGGGEIDSRLLRGGTFMQTVLLPTPNVDLVRKVLRMGYQAARWTSVGLALSVETHDLLLTQWCASQPGAADPSERETSFRQGLNIWRTAIGRFDPKDRTPQRYEPHEGGGQEKRIRDQILRRDGVGQKFI
jgi:hypothetical protein